ncbi:MAG: hypothetical protein N4A38_00615 [Candidatus Gracilibacteria bacterium]|nr:hypothetical protein [Candidatus Gracilibacteria bacterium]
MDNKKPTEYQLMLRKIVIPIAVLEMIIVGISAYLFQNKIISENELKIYIIGASIMTVAALIIGTIRYIKKIKEKAD